MNILDLIPGGRDYRRSGNKNGGEYCGPCTWCGDGGKGRESDRLRVWPQQGRAGTYWCRQCGRGGDAIKYLIDHDGLSFKDALSRLNLTAEEVVGKKQDHVPPGYRPQEAAKPKEVWAEHALKFTDWCHERLLERPRELSWLMARGIGLDLVKKFRLGWNPDHAWREGSAWGVEMPKKENGKIKKLWLPRGLIIPIFDAAGNVISLQVRQPDSKPRYMPIPGSSTRAQLCTRAADAMFVVESRLDAIVLDGVAGDLVGIIAMNNDTAKPTAESFTALNDALFIGVSLDSDLPKYNADTGGMDMPGAKASLWWLKQFPQAVRVPVIGGKDPGEAYEEGVDLRTWIMAALPPFFLIKAELDAEKARRLEKLQAARELEKDLAEAAGTLPPGGKKNEIPDTAETAQVDVPVSQAVAGSGADGAAGEQSEAAGTVEEAAVSENESAVPDVKTVTLKNGRSFCLTSNRDEWFRLVDAGTAVFSEHELQRLQEACGSMTPAERSAAAMLVLDIKEIFPGAYVSRGEKLIKEPYLEEVNAI